MMLYSRHYWPWRRCLAAVNQISLLGILILALLLLVATVVTTRLIGVLVFRSALAPGAAVGLLGLTLATSAFSMHTTAAETLLQCLCEDMERNDGTPMRIYYMPVTLREFLGTLFPDFFRTVVHVKGGAPEPEKLNLLVLLRYFRQSLRLQINGDDSNEHRMDPRKELQRLAQDAKGLKHAFREFRAKLLRLIMWKREPKKKVIKDIADFTEKDDDDVSLGSQDSWNL